jgi:hypothetical protein
VEPLSGEPDERDMEFRLTYAGTLLSMNDRNSQKLRERSLHVHEVRKAFHPQLSVLWNQHPTLSAEKRYGPRRNPGGPQMYEIFSREGFNWLPIVTKTNGLICKVDILMLRSGPPGEVLHDIDNRLKTLFDALRMPDSPDELGSGTKQGKATPGPDEDPFYVLLQDDRLITHLSVTTDILLQPVPNEPPDNAVRLVLNVTVRPYTAYRENLGYA